MDKKERACLATAKWIKKNPDYHPAYFKSPAGKKANTLNGWRIQGIQHPNLSDIYDKHILQTNCNNCEIELKDGRGADGRVLDHHHIEVPTGSTNIREGTICKRCNILRG